MGRQHVDFNVLAGLDICILSVFSQQFHLKSVYFYPIS